jgi:hypothetical protein
MTHIYIVRREDEMDCFTDYALAQRWAAIVDAEIEEEGIIDEETFALMANSYYGEEEP